jgi:hypothetical protein
MSHPNLNRLIFNVTAECYQIYQGPVTIPKILPIRFGFYWLCIHILKILHIFCSDFVFSMAIVYCVGSFFGKNLYMRLLIYISVGFCSASFVTWHYNTSDQRLHIFHILTYEGRLKSSWTGDSTPVLCRGRR